MMDLFAEPSVTNLAWQWVSVVLPGDASTPWGKTLQVFTSVLFAMGAFGLAYGIVAGIVASAYTGKVLGQRWHQIWTPLRIILGLGLLAPLPSTGFSAAHYVLRDVVARGGINLADAAWSVFVSSVAKDGFTIVPASETGSSLALMILKHEICTAVYNKAGGNWGWTAPLPPANGKVAWDGFEAVAAWSYGGTCGSFSFSMPDGRDSFSSARRSAIADMVSKFREEAKRYAKIAAQTQGMNTPAAIANAIRDKTLSPTLVTDIRAAGKRYDAAVAKAAKTEAVKIGTESRSKLVTAAEQNGYLAAGVYWRSLSEVSALTTSLANEAPEETAPRSHGDFGLALNSAFTMLALQISGETGRVALSANDYSAAGDESADFLTRLLAPVARSMAEWASSADEAGGKQDAMGAIISSGHAMIAAGWAAIAAGGVAMVASSNWFSSALGAEGAATWFLDWSRWVVGGLMFLGALRAYVIPMMPFIFVVMSGIATVTALIEAMIAVPLWCLKWCRMDTGDDFAGESVRMGLLLTINLALRPVLTVLALCAAYPIFDATLGTLDKLWPSAFLAQTGGHVVGLIGFLVLTAMQAYLVWYVTVRGFGQIWSLPDRVLSWMGRSGNGGEASLTSGAAGGMLALVGRGNLPKMGVLAPRGPQGGTAK